MSDCAAEYDNDDDELMVSSSSDLDDDNDDDDDASLGRRRKQCQWIRQLLMLMDADIEQRSDVKEEALCKSENQLTTDASPRSPTSHTQLYFVSRLKALALLTVTERRGHAERRSLGVYCDYSCPMTDCFQHSQQQKTKTFPTPPWIMPIGQRPPTAATLLNRFDALDCDSTCCPLKGNLDGTQVYILGQRSKLAKLGGVTCRECQASTCCSKSCMDEHYCNRHTTSPNPHLITQVLRPTTNSAPVGATAALGMLQSQCRQHKYRINLFAESIRLESYRLLSAPGINMEEVAEATEMNDPELRQAVGRQFILTGKMPTLFPALHMQHRLEKQTDASVAVDLFIDSNPHYHEFVETLAVERFIQTHFEDAPHSFFIQAKSKPPNKPPKDSPKDSPAKHDSKDRKGLEERLLKGGGLRELLAEEEEEEDVKSELAKDTKSEDGVGGARLTSEWTLRKVAGLTRVRCVGCKRQFAKRSHLWVCPMCALATCCKSCAELLHQPEFCATIGNYLENTLSNRIQFHRRHNLPPNN